MRTLVIIGAILCAVPLIAGSGKKVVCYWNSFSVRNEGLKGMFGVNDIDPNICTHIIYTYIRFTAGMIVFPDYVEDDLIAFKNLKNQNSNLKLLIGVGGPRQGTQIPSNIASTPTTRNTFSQAVKSFIEQYGLDGCDFDWQWPGQGSGSSTSDKDNFILLLQSLRNVLGTSKVLSISVAPKQEDIDKSYDVLKIHQYVDFINLNTYNFHGIEGETVTAFHSPYRKAPNDLTKEGEWNAISVVGNWLSKGVPSAKLTLGISSYGKSFTLTDIMQTGVGSPVSGLGAKSEFSIENSNTIPYIEICNNILKNVRWQSYWNSAQFSPYAVFNANQWVGYDDLQSVKAKIHLALDNNLGGLNYATIDRDDFSGNCTGTKFPLIKIGYDAMVNDILPTNPATTTTQKPTTTSTSSTTTSSTTTSTSSTTTTTKPPEVPKTTTSAVSKDPDTDDKNTTTEPITEPITTTVEITTEQVTTTVDATTNEPTTEESTTTSTTTKKSTVPKTTVTRTTTTRTTTSENPTPSITPGNLNSIGTTTKKIENDPLTTSVFSTTQEISTPVTTERSTTTSEITTSTKLDTTTEKLPATTSTGLPTPPATPNSNLRTASNSQTTRTNSQPAISTETNSQTTIATQLIQQTTPSQNRPAVQTTSVRTTPYYIPTPPVTPGRKVKRSADFKAKKSFICPEEDGKFKNPDDCKSYFICVRNVPYKFYCNSEKYYDEASYHCDDQSRLRC